MWLGISFNMIFSVSVSHGKLNGADNRLGILREESWGAFLLKILWFRLEGRQYLRDLVHPLVAEIKKETKTKSLEVIESLNITDIF
jgi:hypothetical protein